MNWLAALLNKHGNSTHVGPWDQAAFRSTKETVIILEGPSLLLQVVKNRAN